MKIHADPKNSLEYYLKKIKQDECTLIITTSQKINDDIDIPKNIHLDFKKGGMLSTSNFKVCIYGPISAGLYKIFDVPIDDSYDESIRIFSGIQDVYPEWWGPNNGTMGGITVDVWHKAINRALNSLGSAPVSLAGGEEWPEHKYGGTVKLSKMTYMISKSIKMRSHQWLVGSGFSSIILNISENEYTPAIEIGEEQFPTTKVCIRDLTIRGPEPLEYLIGCYGIFAHRLIRCYIGPIWIYSTGDTGIYIKGSMVSYVKDSVITNCAMHGILMIHEEYINVEPNLSNTSTTIDGCTIRLNHKTGILMIGSESCVITNNTIESNGHEAGYSIGPDPELFQSNDPDKYSTTDEYHVNLYLLATLKCTIQNNYFEHPDSSAIHKVQLAMCGGYNNRIIGNGFHSHVGTLLWACKEPGSTTSAIVPKNNYFVHNRFNTKCDENFQTKFQNGIQDYANENYILDNIGIRWKDQDKRYNANFINAKGYSNGLRQRVQRFTHTSSVKKFEPELGIINSPLDDTGTRKGNIINIDLKDAITITNPKNQEGDLFDGMIIHFIFHNDDKKSHKVTFDNNYYITDFIKVDDQTNKTSSVTFCCDKSTSSGHKWVQLGGQFIWSKRK